jgi:3-deoxy-D-manno-octulosonic-acid transferase
VAATEQTDEEVPGSIWPILLLYNLAFPLLFILYFPIYFFKLQKRGGWRDGFSERFGSYTETKKARLDALERPIWLHAVSVGEVQTALRFIHDWQEKSPDRQFILSTTTSTGQAIARKAASATLVPIYCPLDWFPILSRSLRVLRPAMIIVFEVEIWPSMITAAYARNIPLALVNCRLSDSSADGFKKRKHIFGPLFRRFAMIAAQSDEDAARVSRITGDPKSAVVCSTMKYDQIADPGILNGDILDAVLPPGERTLIVGASTHSGEELALARAFCELRKTRPTLRMVIVPRHAERGQEAQAELQAAGISAPLLSDLRREGGTGDLILGNTTGELLAILAAADLVFIGKSLGDRRGGQNPIESALLGKATIHGPNMDNFRQVVADFKARNAMLMVHDESDLKKALARLIDDPDERAAIGTRARATVAANRGAIQRTITLLEPILEA